MHQNVGSQKGKSGCSGYFLRFAAGIIALLFVAFIHRELDKRFECVEMPNGFLIGRATVFSRMIGWAPDIAIKYPDGRLFLRGDLRMIFWDVNSFSGHFAKTPDGKFNPYIYVNGVGLILKLEQPEMYQKILDKRMKRHIGDPKNYGGHVYRAYMKLYYNEAGNNGEINFQDATHRRYWCPTAWFWP